VVSITTLRIVRLVLHQLITFVACVDGARYSIRKDWRIHSNTAGAHNTLLGAITEVRIVAKCVARRVSDCVGRFIARIDSTGIAIIETWHRTKLATSPLIAVIHTIAEEPVITQVISRYVLDDIIVLVTEIIGTSNAVIGVDAIASRTQAGSDIARFQTVAELTVRTLYGRTRTLTVTGAGVVQGTEITVVTSRSSVFPHLNATASAWVTYVIVTSTCRWVLAVNDCHRVHLAAKRIRAVGDALQRTIT
jgi:hypothetical protein